METLPTCCLLECLAVVLQCDANHKLKSNQTYKVSAFNQKISTIQAAQANEKNSLPVA